MRPILRTAAIALALAAALAGCSSGSSTASSSASTAGGWQTPDDVLAAVAAAGFPCVLPSSDTVPQVITADPFTGTDLGGHALVRCPDFQIMLAKGSVDDGFAALVKCQTVPQSIRDSAEWTVPVVEGSNFLILPANLSSGWAATSQPADVMAKLGGASTTFGTVYDRSCEGRTAPSGGASSGASGEPSAAPSAS